MRAAPIPSSRPSGRRDLIAGRYELVSPLARGGMGEVFLARDLETGASVALKRVRKEQRKRQKVLAHFRAEYHALARFKHPRIIEVFEFGVHEGTPFYTMELLDGEDLRDLGTVPYREACRYLRDVASSLALLHAQRLLHRDLSPRNVRRTADGRCKLLDFGAITPFGVPPNIAGTAPFVPPEAADGAFLDQRADLYSLGALAYFLLSGEHAYPAGKLDELPEMWKRPPSNLRSRVEDVPPDLDALVMSLLEVDPRKRPAHVADVIERLNAIAQLEPEKAPEEAQSFLSSSELHGRTRELGRLRGAIERCLRGEGGAVLFEGPSGIGRSRLLEEVAVLAQTRGLPTVRGVGVHAQSDKPLARQLMQGLKRLVPELRGGDASTQPPPSELEVPLAPNPNEAAQGTYGFEQRAKLVATLDDAFARAATERRFCLIVDDLDLADEFSAAFVAGFAHQARELGVLVVASVSSERSALAKDAVENLRRVASTMQLAPLDALSVREMVSGVLGAVPSIERVVDWLDRGARGNPGLTMELLRLLVQRGVVRYTDGTWVLPEGEITERMPDSLAETLALRLSHLSPGARAMAEVVALIARDVPLEVCLKAFGLGQEAATLSALDELIAAGIFVSSAGGGVAFAQAALREAVQQRIGAERAQQVHEQIARALLAMPPTLERRLEAGAHLVQTRFELEGADLLAETGAQLMHKGRVLADAIPAMEQALEVYERLGAPLRKSLALRQILVLCGYLFDYRLALKHGEVTVARLSELAGLPWVARLRRFVGVTIAFGLAVVIAFVSRPFSSRTRGAPDPYNCLILMARALMGAMGVAATALDSRGTQRLLAVLQPLQGFKFTGVAPVRLACEAFALQMLGREADLRKATERAWAALSGPPRMGMSDPERIDLLVGLGLSSGINACYRIDSDALQRADELEAMGTLLAKAAAHRVRMTYHVVRGDRERANYFRKLIDLHGIQGGTTWQVEWFALPIEGMASLRFGDLVSAKTAWSRLDELVEELPSLIPLRDMVRIGYHWRRGEHQLAVELGEKFMAAHPPRSVIGWGNAYADIAGAHNGLGRHEEALAICDRALAARSEEDRDYVIMYGPLEMERAVALAGVARVVEARATVDELRRHFEEAGEYGLCTILLEQQVKIAALLDHKEWLRGSIQEMIAVADRTESVSLIAHAARIAQTHARKARTSFPAPASFSDTEAEYESEALDAATVMEGSLNPRARLQGLLTEICVTAGAECVGVLFQGETQIRATCGDGDIPTEVREAAQACLESPQASGVEAAGSTEALSHLVETARVRGFVFQRLPGTDSDPQAVLILKRPLSSISQCETLFTELRSALDA